MLDLARWDRPADDHDRSLLDLCVGPTIDIGCGPGRLTADLAQRGHVTLGIDLVDRAVGTTVRRGAPALRRDVFETLPGEGRWRTALLADGNLGIGGDPVALLTRLRRVLDPRGRVVTELAAPGTPAGTGWATLTWGDQSSDPVPWSVVGVDDIDRVADAAGLGVTERHRFGDRWCAVLETS